MRTVALSLCVLLLTVASTWALSPVITANGSTGSVAVEVADDLQVSVGLNTEGVSDPADWWVLCETGGHWYYYGFPLGWNVGIQPTVQTALANFSDFSVFDDSSLPAGAYTFYFGVDLNQNGEIDMSSLSYQSVAVTITEPAAVPDDPGEPSEPLASGAYRVTFNVDARDCGEGAYTYSTDWIFSNNNNAISVSARDYDGDYYTVSGTLQGSSLRGSGSYPEDGGTTHWVGNLEFTADGFSGTDSWTWSDGFFSCSGANTITGVKN